MSWRVLVVAMLCLSCQAQNTATKDKTSSHEVVYADETLPGDDVGFWPVFDTFSSRIADANKEKTDQDHPSCLLLKMKVVVTMGNETIVDVPRTAKISNDTCFLPEEDHYNEEYYVDYTFTPQSAHLTWPEGEDGFTDSSLVMTFISGPFGQGNQGYEEWFWMSGLKVETPTVKLNLKNTRAFAAPLLFAFHCKGQTLSFKAKAMVKANKEDVKGQKEDVVVTFHHLEVEPFRKNRYYESMTHLKWDCHRGWPYSFVPIILMLVVVSMAILTVTGMCLRWRKWKRDNSSQEATENLIAESEDSFANSDSHNS